MLVSFLFFGGGQLLKRQFKRFFAMWALLIGVVAVGGLIGWIVRRDTTAASVAFNATVVGVFAVWLYQIVDALVHW